MVNHSPPAGDPSAGGRRGVTQPDVSDLFRGHISGYSMERLYRFLEALEQDVQIVVQPKPRSRKAALVRTLVREKRQKTV